ncbi:hypothetical protein [Sporosarcina sp. FSL K6-1508]|uniref:hypothetical protein n=1 Tax=Sporosarcina sp. FSL K6-1508 TaxID=2921553 RepID=UPI0030F78502
MKHVIDYVQINCMGQFEFGFALTEENDSLAIEIMVVDHGNYMVRTLGKTLKLEEAFSVVQDCVQNGFYVNGLLFTGIPGYSVASIADFVSTR